MKKQLISISILGCISVASLSACCCRVIKPEAVGANSPAAADKAEVVAAANFAVKEEEKVIRKGNNAVTEQLTLVTILGVEEQVVAGMSYRLKLKVLWAGQEKTAMAVVWWQSWNKETPYSLTSWEWR